MPMDWGDVSFDLNKVAYDNIRIYHEFKFGSLLHLVMTDVRLYRDDHIVSEAAVALQTGGDPVNGSSSVDSRYFVPRLALLGAEAQTTAALQRPPSILGTKQTQWGKDTLKASTSRWKVWGNEVTLNRMWIDLTVAPVPAQFQNLYVVIADGYPAHRAEMMGFLKAQNVTNVVAITGDLHAFQCGLIRDTPETTGTPVAVDFVRAGISSSSFYSYLKAGSDGTPLAPLVATPANFDAMLRAHNPDLRYADDDAQGYAVAAVMKDSFTVVFNKVKPLEGGNKPAAPLAKRTRITLQNGSTVPVVEDNV